MSDPSLRKTLALCLALVVLDAFVLNQGVVAIPTYIAEVPLAKYTLLFNQFSYHSSGDVAMLSYIALPPFGRPTYNFKNKRWGYLD